MTASAAGNHPCACMGLRTLRLYSSSEVGVGSRRPTGLDSIGKGWRSPLTVENLAPPRHSRRPRAMWVCEVERATPDRPTGTTGIRGRTTALPRGAPRRPGSIRRSTIDEQQVASYDLGCGGGCRGVRHGRVEVPRTRCGCEPNFDIDVNALTNTIQQAIVSAANREGAVKSMMEAAYNQTKQRYNVMVFNLNQNYDDSQLSGVKSYTNHTYSQIPYGVWVFESGTFVNQGDGGFINWAFAGSWKRTGKDDKTVVFSKINKPRPPPLRDLGLRRQWRRVRPHQSVQRRQTPRTRRTPPNRQRRQNQTDRQRRQSPTPAARNQPDRQGRQNLARSRRPRRLRSRRPR